MRMMLAALVLSAAIAPAQATIVASKIVGWATVNKDGTIANSKNVTSHGHDNAGIYTIVFQSNISACALSATTQYYGVNISAYPVAGARREVAVVTDTASEGFIDSPFSLTVIC